MWLYRYTVLHYRKIMLHISICVCVYTHTILPWHYQRSKKMGNIVKTVAVHFASSCCLDKLLFKQLSISYVCPNMMASYFRSPQHLVAFISVISLSVYHPSFLSQGWIYKWQRNTFFSFIRNLLEACSEDVSFYCTGMLLRLKAAQKFNRRPRASS